MANDKPQNAKPTEKPGPTRPAPPLLPNPKLDNFLKKGGENPPRTRVNK
jgi:hypothetical protein